MEMKKIYLILFIVVFTVLITYLHYFIFREQGPHVILEELYYIPILLGAWYLGLKGAIVIYFFVSAVYLPYLFGDWVVNTLDLADRLFHLLFLGVFAFIAGFLIDRERKYQKRSEMNRYLAGLGQAASAIVHDLRNPLISILGFTKRIREAKGDIGTAVRVIEDSVLNIQRIVDGDLDFARPLQLEFNEKDIRTVIDQACESCKAKAEEIEVTLSKDIPPHPIHLGMDGFYMQRALINLINNAIEASGHGQEVTVGCAKKKNTGTGLGMAIARKIVDEHKGKIHVNSQPGNRN